MYTVEFTLKALSDMVHFQVEDVKPTIRASELKPMFDKFLSVIDKEKELKVCRLLVDGDTTEYYHFDYQVSIIDSSPNYAKDTNEKGKEFFFKKLNEETKKKELAFHSVRTSPVVTFRTKHLKLAQYVHEYFPAFVSVSYFGFRKGKGYGQFDIVGSSIKRKELILRAYSLLEKDIVSFEIENKANIDISNYINQRNTALKQTVLKDFVKNGLLKTRKENKLVGDYMFTKKEQESEGLRFFRLLFGLAPQYGDFTVSDTDKNNPIARVANPIKYHILDDKTILVAIDRGRLLEIMAESKGKLFLFQKNKGQKKFKKIKALTVEEFNIDIIIEYIKKNLPVAKIPNNKGGKKAKFNNRNAQNSRSTNGYSSKNYNRKQGGYGKSKKF